MLSTAKILNTATSGNLLSEQSLQRPGPMSLPLNSQQLYHHSTSFTPSPTNSSTALSLSSTQLRSLQSNKKLSLLYMRVLPRSSQHRP